MLKVDLARLWREGPQHIQASVPPEAPLWEGSGLSFEGPLDVDLRARRATGGEVVVRGRLTGTAKQECRRCLEPVDLPMDEEVTLVFAYADELAPAEEAEVREIKAGASEIDVSEAIREELILSTSPYIVCDPGCRGLCPTCGVNLNEETCACVRIEHDPRWDALRALKNQ